MRRHRHDDDDRILKDGQRLHVPMTMMDHLTPSQRAVAQSSTRVTDSQGGIVGLHRPGLRIAAQTVRCMMHVTLLTWPTTRT